MLDGRFTDFGGRAWLGVYRLSRTKLLTLNADQLPKCRRLSIAAINGAPACTFKAAACSSESSIVTFIGRFLLSPQYRICCRLSSQARAGLPSKNLQWFAVVCSGFGPIGAMSAKIRLY